EERAAREIAAAQAAAPEARLTAELNTLRATLARQENEIAKLLDRIKELAPLKLQLTERDLRLRTLAAEIGQAAKSKDDEITQLQHALEAANQARTDE